MTTWSGIDTAPTDRLVLLCSVNWEPAKMVGRKPPVKVGGYWDGQWHIFGASWKPTHWMELPEPPETET